MFNVKVNVDGTAEVINFFPELMGQVGEDFIQRAGLRLQLLVKQNAPVDTGRLRADEHLYTKLAGKDSQAEVGTEVFYAPYVENGTSPHFPPVDAIRTWASRHGFKSPWALARSIAKKGTKAHPFYKPAIATLEEEMDDRLTESFLRVKKKYGV